MPSLRTLAHARPDAAVRRDIELNRLLDRCDRIGDELDFQADLRRWYARQEIAARRVLHRGGEQALNRWKPAPPPRRLVMRYSAPIGHVLRVR